MKSGHGHSAARWTAARRSTFCGSGRNIPRGSAAPRPHGGGLVTRAAMVSARAEAQRFMDLVTAAIAELDAEDRAQFTTGTRKSGAVRRASMDLTRSLTDLRRSTHWRSQW